MEDRLVRIALSGVTEPGDRASTQLQRRRWAVQEADLQLADRRTRSWLDRGIHVAVPGEDAWPTQLSDLAVPPLALYQQGRPLRPALLRSVAIVGSRRATPAGRALAASWAADLVRLGFTIVSGGAFGIDAAAHQGALSAGGRTVAVLAGGVDVDSPRANGALLQAIRERGTVVAELPPGSEPARHRFLPRNRLIAALTPGTLVVQAADRSGALSTARQAADLNRVVMAVPGAVTDEAHAGCNALIRDNSALLVGSAREVAELLLPLGTAASALS